MDGWQSESKQLKSNSIKFHRIKPKQSEAKRSKSNHMRNITFAPAFFFRLMLPLFQTTLGFAERIAFVYFRVEGS
jgi:hypothetical protein